MEIKEKSKEQLLKQIKALEDELEIQTWGLKKTNEAVKSLYNQLQEKTKELQKLDQLKSDFVSHVSHELRTPLSIIKEGVSLVLDEVLGKINDNQRNILKMSKENIDRLARIINDLLDISKIESGRVELKKILVDFSSMVKDVSEKWKLESNKKQQSLRVFIPDLPISIYIDPDKITQLLTNLISNAIKYTPQKGKIDVELKEKKDWVEISVSDTGRGIAKEDLPKVFSKFQQFARQPGPGEKGTGLGLAIAKELVQMHRGTIMVNSQLGKGSKFTFSLPKMNVEEVFKEYINNGIREAVQRKSSLSLVVIHIARFDQLLKKLGYDQAHNLLKDIEKVINACLHRRADTVVRDTGELIVLLFDIRKADVAVVKARIKKAIDAYLSEGKEEWIHEVGVSFGNATYPDEARNDQELLNKARAIPGQDGEK